MSTFAILEVIKGLLDYSSKDFLGAESEALLGEIKKRGKAIEGVTNILRLAPQLDFFILVLPTS